MSSYLSHLPVLPPACLFRGCRERAVRKTRQQNPKRGHSKTDISFYPSRDPFISLLFSGSPLVSARWLP